MAADGEDEPSLKDVLNRNLDDIDLILRQVAEILTIPKSERSDCRASVNVENLIKLLQMKEIDFARNLGKANKQVERQHYLERLEAHNHMLDDDIAKIQTCLKDAERMLITAIFQANQKLKSIAQAENRKVSAEELIEYAHKISASNSVAAPPTWQQGDPERPFPTDFEMRNGWLTQLSVPMSQMPIQMHAGHSDMVAHHPFMGQISGSIDQTPPGRAFANQMMPLSMPYSSGSMNARSVSGGSQPSTPTQPLTWGSPRQTFSRHPIQPHSAQMLQPASNASAITESNSVGDSADPMSSDSSSSSSSGSP